ncbi:hypothetical protein ORN63_004517 [Vibrio parahaemolyticus]|nr:hypothetical protein [Vibrio parahaemolyticus]EKD4049926.1 hypothetical protein [Vibrio parahaemolyticus]
MSQTTTMIYRNANYQGRAKCAKSLSHSLRIKTNAFKPNEWAEDLTDSSWIFTPNDTEGRQINSISEEEKKAFIDAFLDDEFSENSASPKVKSDFAKYRYKFEQKIINSGGEIAKQLSAIYNDRPEDYRERIEAIEGLKRKGQLTKMIDKYMTLAKQVEGTSDQRESKVHEAFFKFPHQHGVKPDPKRMAECMRSFYETHAPDYSIGLLVVHDDEREKNQTTGAHPHIFVSTQNNTTGERDLAKQLRREANKYLQENPTEVALWNPDTQKHETHTVTNIDAHVSGYAATKLQGIIIQDMFMKHVQEKFPELDVVWTKNRERKVKAFHEQYEDAKKPKADRVYNLNNYLHLRAEKIDKALKNNEKIITSQRVKHRSITQEITQAQTVLNSVTRQKQDAEYELYATENKLDKLKTALDAFITPYKKLIESILSNKRTEATIHADECLKQHQRAPEEAQIMTMDMINQEAQELDKVEGVAPDLVDIHTEMKEEIEVRTKLKI